MFERRTRETDIGLVGFRVRADERRALEQYAAQCNMTLSGFIRQAIGEAIRRLEQCQNPKEALLTDKLPACVSQPPLELTASKMGATNRPLLTPGIPDGHNEGR